MFCTICNFEKLTQKTAIWLLNDIISDMDELCHEYGVEKVKTIGTKYMAMSEPDDDFVESHLTRMAVFALNLQEFIKVFNERTDQNFALKIGLHVGPVATGVIGTKTFSYDVWGDTVNISSRMETTGKDGKIQVTEEIYNALSDNPDFRFESRGNVYVKGKGILNTYYLYTINTEKNESMNALSQNHAASTTKQSILDIAEGLRKTRSSSATPSPKESKRASTVRDYSRASMYGKAAHGTTSTSKSITSVDKHGKSVTSVDRSIQPSSSKSRSNQSVEVSSNKFLEKRVSMRREPFTSEVMKMTTTERDETSMGSEYFIPTRNKESSQSASASFYSGKGKDNGKSNEEEWSVQSLKQTGILEERDE